VSLFKRKNICLSRNSTRETLQDSNKLRNIKPTDSTNISSETLLDWPNMAQTLYQCHFSVVKLTFTNQTDSLAAAGTRPATVSASETRLVRNPPSQ
jgi:hypothetical protein